MRIRFLCLAAALSMTFTYSSIASLIGSTYDGTLATSDSDLSVSPAATNSYTDLTNPLTFCVGGLGESTCGLSGAVSFTDVDATDANITFELAGSVSAVAGDTFTVDLGNFATPDGSSISGIDQSSVSLTDGTFQLTSFNGIDAIFTGTVGPDGFFTAGAGQDVVFKDALNPAPEPASILLSVCGLAAVAVAARRRRTATA